VYNKLNDVTGRKIRGNNKY